MSHIISVVTDETFYYTWVQMLLRMDLYNTWVQLLHLCLPQVPLTIRIPEANFA